MKHIDEQMYWCYWDDIERDKLAKLKSEENESDTKQVSS